MSTSKNQLFKIFIIHAYTWQWKLKDLGYSYKTSHFSLISSWRLGWSLLLCVKTVTQWSHSLTSLLGSFLSYNHTNQRSLTKNQNMTSLPLQVPPRFQHLAPVVSAYNVWLSLFKRLRMKAKTLRRLFLILTMCSQGHRPSGSAPRTSHYHYLPLSELTPLCTSHPNFFSPPLGFISRIPTRSFTATSRLHRQWLDLSTEMELSAMVAFNVFVFLLLSESSLFTLLPHLLHLPNILGRSGTNG